MDVGTRDSWFCVLKRLIQRLIAEDEDEDGNNWRLEDAIKLYRRIQPFNEVLGSSLMLDYGSSLLGFRVESFPEFVIRHQLKSEWCCLPICLTTVERYALQVDDVDIAKQVFDHVLVDYRVLHAIRYRAWKVLQDNINGYNGDTICVAKLGTPENHISVIIAKTDDNMLRINGFFSRIRSLTGLNHHQQTCALLGYLMAPDFDPSLLVGSEEKVRPIIFEQDLAGALKKLINAGFFLATKELFLSGGFNILLLGIYLGHIDAETATLRIVDIISYDNYNAIPLITLLQSLSTSGWVLKREHYERIAVVLIKSACGESSTCPDIESLLWMVHHNKLSDECLRILRYFVDKSDTDAYKILHGMVIPG